MAWTHELGGEVVAAPTVDVAAVACVATEGGLLHAVRDAGVSATRLWTLRLGAEVAEAPEVGALGVLHVALRTAAQVGVGRAPGARRGTFLPASCEGATRLGRREVELCPGEAACHASADCARRTGCRGPEYRRPPACAAPIWKHGGETAQSALLAAGTAECIQRGCGGCR
ncbi:MAG: hypothetical protein IT376_09280 [Polyangiaceae bacterium]|nr:hypothetical protein [Polyangiaceae bacterium]